MFDTSLISVMRDYVNHQKRRSIKKGRNVIDVFTNAQLISSLPSVVYPQSHMPRLVLGSST